MNSFFELLMLKDAARIFIRNVSSVFIGCLMPNQRLVYIFIPSFAIWRHWCYLCELSRVQGITCRFSFSQKWFIAAPSIATTMEKRWSNWAFFSFPLMRNIVKSGRRKWDAWIGNQTKIRGCAQRILSHTVMPLIRKFSSLWAYQSRKRYYWSTMLFQRSLITKTGRRNRKAKLVNGSTRNRRNQRLTRDGKC